MTEENKKRALDALDKLPDMHDNVVNFLKEKFPENFKKEYIIYSSNKRKKSVGCFCTACTYNFTQEYQEAFVGCSRGIYGVPKYFGFKNSEIGDSVFSLNSTLCPVCGDEVTAIHISDLRQPRSDVEMCAVSVHVIDGLILIVTWQYNRYINSDGNFTDEVNAIDANIFGKDFRAYAKKSIAVYNPYTGGKYCFYATWFVLSKFDTSADMIYRNRVLPFYSSELEESELPNCKLDVYLNESDSERGVFPALYLSLYKKYPNIENLVMQGASYLLNERFGEVSNMKSFVSHRDIDLKKKRPSSILGLNKEEYRVMVKNLNLPLESIMFYRKYRDIFPLQDFLYFEAETSIDEMESLADYSYGFIKPLRYLEKQEFIDNGVSDVPTLVDYWKMMTLLGGEFDPFPQNLKTAHDRACELQKKKSSYIKRKKYKARFVELSKYCFESEGLIIRPCKSDTELYQEGQKLHHCVYAYSEKYLLGKSAIFFIRKIDSPDEPYFTLEFYEDKFLVNQNLGKYNCSRTDEVIVFEKKWLEFVKKVMEDEKNGKSSIKARKARVASA
ncbi:MAG: PcfJ domain-containing protein [Clostridia bacterium]|nr:PcfJ domain-containing protein [Clostridia bacterium]